MSIADKLKATRHVYNFADESGHRFQVITEYDEEWGWNAHVTMSAHGMRTAEGAVGALGDSVRHFMRMLDESVPRDPEGDLTEALKGEIERLKAEADEREATINELQAMQARRYAATQEFAQRWGDEMREYGAAKSGLSLGRWADNDRVSFVLALLNAAKIEMDGAESARSHAPGLTVRALPKEEKS